jgi:cysteine synthase A
VSGYGTGGTVTGAGQMIRLARPEVKIIITEPAGASLLEGNDWAPHKVQGWTPDFIPNVLDREVFDENIPVTDEEAIENALALASREGIFCGISSGGTFAAALKVAEKADKGSVILAMLPDTGERYLSTPLFENISEESDSLD